MSGGSAETGDPNLTPILDMVFQLITFFMLVMNFKAASMDLDLKLPVVGSARMVEGGTSDLLVLNINSKGHLRVFGEEKPDIKGYLRNEAQVSLLMAQKRNPDLKLGEDLPSIVVVRADKATPFKLLNRVITACQEFGFRNFALKAKSATEE